MFDFWRFSHFGKFRMLRLIARFYKYDFWNIWKILDRHRCSKIFLKCFPRWKFFLKKCFSGKFWKFLKIFGKSQNSIGILKKSQYWLYWLFLRILIEFWLFPKKFKISPKIIFWESFFISKKNPKIFSNTYVDPKFSKDSKNRTYKTVRSS